MNWMMVIATLTLMVPSLAFGEESRIEGGLTGGSRGVGAQAETKLGFRAFSNAALSDFNLRLGAVTDGKSVAPVGRLGLHARMSESIPFHLGFLSAIDSDGRYLQYGQVWPLILEYNSDHHRLGEKQGKNRLRIALQPQMTFVRDLARNKDLVHGGLMAGGLVEVEAAVGEKVLITGRAQVLVGNRNGYEDYLIQEEAGARVKLGEKVYVGGTVAVTHHKHKSKSIPGENGTEHSLQATIVAGAAF